MYAKTDANSAQAPTNIWKGCKWDAKNITTKNKGSQGFPESLYYQRRERDSNSREVSPPTRFPVPCSGFQLVSINSYMFSKVSDIKVFKIMGFSVVFNCFQKISVFFSSLGCKSGCKNEVWNFEKR